MNNCECEYKGGCPIEPLIAKQMEIATQIQQLRVFIERADTEQAIRLYDQVKNLKAAKDRLEEGKKQHVPCSRCLYQ